MISDQGLKSACERKLCIITLWRYKKEISTYIRHATIVHQACMGLWKLCELFSSFFIIIAGFCSSLFFSLSFFVCFQSRISYVVHCHKSSASKRTNKELAKQYIDKLLSEFLGIILVFPKLDRYDVWYPHISYLDIHTIGFNRKNVTKLTCTLMQSIFAREQAWWTSFPHRVRGPLRV